jgi:predicted glycoside hydrolase/deacetylase ChbG (UPF0249 family)
MPLILNADDFGLTAGINRAIVELFRANALTSTTLMATAPAADDAIALALANPGLGVGCHLNFVEGYPSAHPESIPSLLGADGKTFRPSLIDFAQALLRGKIEAAELALETQAQIQRLQRAGIDVTHVDTHKHIHVFPPIARTIAHIAQRCGIHAIRNPLPQIASRELQTTDGTLGIAGTGIMTPDILRRTLAAMPTEGTFELCCHPGHRDAALDAAPTRLRASREAEFRMLLEVLPEFSRTEPGLNLIHYGNLGVAGLQRASGQFQPHTGYEKVV